MSLQKIIIKLLAMLAAQLLLPSALDLVHHLIVFDVVISFVLVRHECFLKPHLLTQAAESIANHITHTSRLLVWFV
jgi:hypothetical protein